MNVIQEINNINDKFATLGSKLRIEKRGEKLNIRGSLPSKEDKNNFKIQRISLGLKADISGLEEAKKKLQLINLQLELNQFDWILWLVNPNKKGINNAFEFPNRLNQFEEFFFRERKNEYLSSTRKTTWRSSYKPYMKRILKIYYDCDKKDLDKVEIKDEIEKINNNLSKIEKIKKYFLINEKFSIENGMLTPTLKLKRYKIVQKYKNEFEKLY